MAMGGGRAAPVCCDILRGRCRFKVRRVLRQGNLLERNRWPMRKGILDHRHRKTLTAIMLAISVLLGACSPAMPGTVAGTATPSVTPTASPTATSTPEPPTATPPPTSTPTPEPLCGGPPVMMILAVGIDSRSNSYLYGLADVIRIVRVDFIQARVSVMALPRAIQVRVPGIGDHGITSGLLNQSYFWASPGMGYYKNPWDGAGLLALTLEENFGLSVDHYIVANMVTFRRFIDSIGGVYVYVPVTLDGRRSPSEPKQMENWYFASGARFMNGANALKYARIRKLDSIFARDERQNDLLVSIWERLVSPEMADLLSPLIEKYHARVLTDLALEQMTQLACLGLRLSRDDIQFVGFSKDFFETRRNEQGQLALYADEDELSEIMAQFSAGIWPSWETPAPTETPIP
jgi:LCP family protein required for cell wall assembly